MKRRDVREISEVSRSAETADARWSARRRVVQSIKFPNSILVRADKVIE
jgi:hypothetical protein